MLKYILGLAFFCLVFLPEKGIAQWSSPPIILGADHRIPIDSLDTDGNGAVDIEAPGHYYLRENLMVNSPSGSGILIDSDNVNIDLNGYAILAGQNEPNDGIRVLGGHNNITIKNGSIIGFDQYGIDAIATKSSTFRNLLVKDNGFDGIIVDYDCLIVHCTALNNGRDGIEADDGSIIRDCTAAFNEGNGIEAGDGCLVFNCMAYGNGLDGIDVDNAVRVEGCTAHD
ncbi:MAG: right-handed parallel beta-helix repeat-containing protein, partial [Bacteroidota bacterium]